MMAEVDREVTHEILKLMSLMDDTTKSKLNTRFTQDVRSAKRKKEAFDSMFLPAQKPNITSATTEYVKSPATRNLYENLQRLAEDDTKIPIAKEINTLTEGMGKRMTIQSGHQPNDAYGEGLTQVMLIIFIAWTD